MRIIAIYVIAMVVLAFNEKDKLTGRWQSQPSVTGAVTGVVFKPDNTFEGFVNKKPFVTGKYRVQDDLFSFTDNGCDGAEGIYKMIFFSNEDSLRFEPITDTCTGRRAGMSKLIMGRVN